MAAPGLLVIVTVGLLVTYFLLVRSQTLGTLPTRKGACKSMINHVNLYQTAKATGAKDALCLSLLDIVIDNLIWIIN